MLKNIISITAFLFFISIFSKAQSLWINAMPMHTHPSFAGNTSQLRLSTLNGIKLENRKEGNSFHLNNYISVDHFIPKLHSAIGLQSNYLYLKDLTNTQTSGNYNGRFLENILTVAPKLSFYGKYTLSPSLQISHRYLREQIYFSSVESDSYFRNNTSRMGLKGGLMFNSKKYFIGVAIPFFNSKFYSESITIIGGYTFKKSPESHFSFTPILQLGGSRNLSYMYNEINFGNISLNFQYKKAIAGADLFGNMMIGYQHKNFKLMLIQNVTRGYSAQFSLRYLFGSASQENLKISE